MRREANMKMTELIALPAHVPIPFQIPYLFCYKIGFPLSRMTPNN